MFKGLAGLLLAVVCLAACSADGTAKPTNFTAQHCWSNVECCSGQSCLTWREDYGSPPVRRDGFCVSAE